MHVMLLNEESISIQLYKSWSSVTNDILLSSIRTSLNHVRKRGNLKGPHIKTINLLYASKRALQQEAGTGDDGNSRRIYCRNKDE